MKFSTKVILAGAGLCGLAYVLYKAGGLAGEALQAINPLNNDNVINQGATSVYQGITGSSGTIGTDLYDVTHPAAAEGSNPVYGAATSIWQKVTGTAGSVGTGIYDIFH